jgi:uroporphyrinogen-III synthase
MRVWVTRASPGAEATAARLTDLGHQPLAAPVLVARPIAGARLDFRGVGALAFTSANAVAAFAARYPLGARNLPVFAVGETTAAAARDAGFMEVTSADGDVRALAELILAQREAFRGGLLHPSAKEPAGDLAATLRADGLEAASTPIYETVEATAMPAPAAAALVEGALDAVLIHSPKAARALVRLTSGLASGLRAFALSEACAAPLRAAGFESVAVSPHPAEADLLALLT